MKTPEEMENAAILDISLLVHNDNEWNAAKKAWFAGYKAAQQWISVKERLPKDGEEVLVFGRYIPKVLGVRSRYKGDQEWKYTWEGEDEWVYTQDDVTHWMSLPEAPKEEK